MKKSFIIVTKIKKPSLKALTFFVPEYLFLSCDLLVKIFIFFNLTLIGSTQKPNFFLLVLIFEHFLFTNNKSIWISVIGNLKNIFPSLVK